MEPHLPHGPLGLYIHIPWCLTRCPYCVFFAMPFSRSAFDHYLQILVAEKKLYLPMIDRSLSSVYFGGGTPSLLSGQQIKAIISDLPLQDNAEITLEINPIQINERFLLDLQESGLNRVSLGVQSLIDSELTLLERKHKAADIAPALGLLMDHGYRNVSADLIYGLPNSNIKQLQINLEMMLALPINHLSCYLLELPDTGPLSGYKDQIPDDETLAEQYHLIRKMVEAAGFVQYEISNFARPGHASHHNLLYWHGDDYLAWGASASGHFGSAKYHNPADLEAYESNVRAGTIFPESDEGHNEAADYVMMRLRLREGLDFAEYQKRFGQSFGRADSINKLHRLGMLELDDAGIRLSDEALFISNAVIAELL